MSYPADVQTGARDTIARYAITMDTHDIDGCTNLFAADAQVEAMGEIIIGAAQLRAWMERLAQRPPGIHLTTNIVVDQIDETHARAVSSIAMIRPGEGGGWKVTAAGNYHDEFVFARRRWLFTLRRMIITL